MVALDPEDQRIAELCARVRAGTATEVEREELALYRSEGDSARNELIVNALAESELGAGWLARVEADRRIQRVEDSRRARGERAVGLGLIGAGFVGSMLASPLGPVAWISGIGLLLYSVTRVRLRTLRDDPYRKIKQ